MPSRGSTAVATSAGRPSAAPTAFHVGVVGNPTAPRLDDEVKRFEYKVEAGAEFAVTLPIFDLDALDAFLEQDRALGLPIIAAVRPFDSLLHAEFLANEVPNLRVPEALLARMRRADAAGARRPGRPGHCRGTRRRGARSCAGPAGGRTTGGRRRRAGALPGPADPM